MKQFFLFSPGTGWSATKWIRRAFRNGSRTSLLLVLSASFNMTSVRAANVVSSTDSIVLSTIFGDDILEQNVHVVRATAAKMPLQRRFEFLSNWVLPGPGHSKFRLAMDFTPTSPVGDPTPSSNLPTSVTGPSLSKRVVIGGELVAPAMDLVAVAADLRILPMLRRRIEEVRPQNRSVSRNRQTMLVLCDIAAGNVEAVENGFANLYTGLVTMDRTQLHPRCPETLAVYAGVQKSETREIAQELLSYLLDSYIRVDRQGSQNAWDRQMSALGGQVRSVRDTTDERVENRPTETQNWASVSRMTAQSRGTGFPPSAWKFNRGEVRNLASHDETYLYFRSPLRGDFEVECDVTLNGWQHSHLSVAGLWVAPAWGMTTYDSGIFRQRRARGKIQPRLTATNEWIRYRTVVRNSKATTYFDGRKIHEESLGPDHEPWVAIRSPWYADGVVRDLRITGQPQIPEQLNISAARGLPGWFSYQNRSLGKDWIQSSSGRIVGARKAELHGAFSESLLQYNRPMLEDGVIEYEFLYSADKVEVHPALDRLCFLLQPDGVKTHLVTDNSWDRTDSDPRNEFEEPSFRRGPDRLPLQQGEWNLLRLTHAGDTVQLTLNNVLVYEHRLDSANQRTFGLFHYSDQTEAQIRNVTWRGNWPMTLPSPESQQLADVDIFPELELTDVYQHDFVKSGFPAFAFTTGGFQEPGNKLHAGPDGLTQNTHSSPGFHHCFITPNLRTHGDFDITATFDNLEMDPETSGSSGISLGVVLADNLTTHANVYRGLVRKAGNDDLHTSHLYIHRTKAEIGRQIWLGNISEESRSGRLRLIRHRDTLYSLFAENDSPNFRLVSTTDIPDADPIPSGIRMIAVGADSETNVVWKSIEVRAENLTGAATEDTEARIAELNNHRDKLPQRFTHDFSQQAPATADFSRWADTTQWEEGDEGLNLTLPGNDLWRSAGINIRKAIVGDFDIRANFKLVNLPTPAPSLLSNVYLQMRFRDKKQSRPTLVINKRPTGRTTIHAEVWEPRPTGGYIYRQIASFEAESVSDFRFVRRGRELWYIVSSKDFTRDHVVGKILVPEIAIMQSDLALTLHAGGEDRETKVLLKQIDIRAEGISEQVP